ncbi:MAG: hypothetical protein GX422_11855 [Deltaproteobacteria bacterium]|nr:hypothetical protein [Deltaproteobacteria bacterium]
MKKMWIRPNEKCDREDLKKRLEEIGKIEEDSQHADRLILTFHNQSESGVRMAGFRLSEDFIQDFDDFDMIR